MRPLFWSMLGISLFTQVVTSFAKWGAYPRHSVEYWFSGDPLITKAHREQASGNPSLAIVDLLGDAKQGWTFSHDIQLEAD